MRSDTDCDPTYVRTQVDPSVEDTIVDPRAMMGLAPELEAMIRACESPAEAADMTRMGYLVPSEDDDIFTVNGYDELPLPEVLPPPPTPSKSDYLTSGFKGPPNADTAILPRDLSEQSLVESMSLSLEHLAEYARLSTFPELPPPEPLDLPPLVMPPLEETRAFGAVIPSDSLVKVVSDSFPSYQAVRAVTPRRANLAPSNSAQPAMPSRPKIDVPPQRYIHTVISQPHPSMIGRKKIGLWARFMSWLLPARPGFVDSPRTNYYGPKTPGRVAAGAR